MERIRNIDDAADYLNTHADWVLVKNSDHTVLSDGYITQEIPPTLEEATLYIDSAMNHPRIFTHETVSVNLRKFKPSNYTDHQQAVKGETGADTIKARESVYGPFEVHAEAEQDILEAVQKQPGWVKLNKVQKSAMQMIVHKMARILNSSADYDDNWHDISGYATLAEKDIKNRKSVKPD